VNDDRSAGGPRHEGPSRLARTARTDRQLLRRSSLTLVSRGLTKFALILFLVVAARLLTVEEFASYSYLVVVAAAFTILSDTGVPLVASRDAAAGRASPGDLFSTALPVVLVTGGAAAVVLPVFGAIDSGPGSTFVPVLITAGYVFFNRFFDLTATLLRGIGRFKLEAVLQSAGAIGFIVAAIAATLAGWGVTGVLFMLFLKEMLSAAVSYVALRPDLERRTTAHAGDWRRLLALGIRLSLAGMALALVMRIPLALFGNIGTAEEVALFSAAQRFGDTAYILAMSLGVALLPGIAYLAPVDRSRARALLHRVLLGMVAGASVIGVAAAPLAEPIMRVIFGSDFAAGAGLLRILLVGMPAYAALGICWYAVIAFDGERRLLAIGVVGLGICGVLSAMLIPSAGDSGAAWTYVGSLYALAGLAFVALERQVSGPAPARAPTPERAEPAVG
jgi:O-antigen/teichoic acid export membrane protein